MRFTISSSALNNKLISLSKVINSKNSMQILSDFLFEIKDNTLHLTASDSENTMKTAIQLVESDQDIRFAINNHDILEALKSFSEQPITFEISLDNNLATIHYLNGQFALPIDNADEYPEVNGMTENTTVITIQSNILSDTITRSIFATNKEDDLRPIMGGVYFDMSRDNLAIVATDGHKLVKTELLQIKNDNHNSFVLPKKPASILRNILTKDESPVFIRFDERNAEIEFDEGVLYCRLIEGRYPNYFAVIPSDNPNNVTIDRLALLSALRRVLPFANTSSNLIRFKISQGQVQLDAEDFDFSKTATESIVCEYDGMPMSIGFKGPSFLEILSNISSQDVVIKLGDPSRSGVVMPIDQPDNQEILMLLMPMLIKE